jgi:hypothetical protein
MVEDAGFYWAHRLTHESQFLYKFHKIHHEYTETFSLATEYTHPVDYVIGILVSIWLCRYPPLFLSFSWGIVLIASCSFFGRFGRFSSAPRDTVGTIFLGAPPGSHCLYLIPHSMITIIAEMWEIIAEVFIYGITSMGLPLATLGIMG